MFWGEFKGFLLLFIEYFNIFFFILNRDNNVKICVRCFENLGEKNFF